MKKNYLICGDIFITFAFASFVVGIVLKLLSITKIFWNITPDSLLKLTPILLLFSVALSLIEIATKTE